MTHALQVLHTLQWHHPGGRALCNWLKPPLRTTTPTRTLYWVLLKNMSWVLGTLLRRGRENTALLSNCGLTGDATTRFPC